MASARLRQAVPILVGAAIATAGYAVLQDPLMWRETLGGCLLFVGGAVQAMLRPIGRRDVRTVMAVGTNTLTVTDASGFRPGDRFEVL